MKNNSLLSSRQALYGSLLAAGLLEAFVIVTGSLFNYISVYMAEYFLIFPVMTFLGAALTAETSRDACRDLLIGIACVVWFCAVQANHRIHENTARHVGLFACAYLLAFPFASVFDDGKKQHGLKTIALLFTAACVVLCLGGLLLRLNLLPGRLRTVYSWDGSRLRAIWHMNITASLLMIGIAVCLGSIFLLPSKALKGLAAVLTAVFFCFLTLTNGRTTIALSCAMIGGTVFLCLYRKGWKGLVIGFVLAVIIMGGLFVTATRIFEVHRASLAAEYYTNQSAAETAPTTAAEAADVHAETTTAPTLPKELDTGENRSLTEDWRSLNNRDKIWAGAIAALKDNPQMLTWGTHYVGETVTFYKGGFFVEHCHNSFLEITMWLGIPGLLMALYFSFLTLRNGFYLLFSSCSMWCKCISMLAMCLLASSLLEPILFTGAIDYHFINFFYFLCVGYTEVWWRSRKENA